MKLLVCGGRDFKDKNLLTTFLDTLQIECVVHGGAAGADSLAGEYALRRGIPEIIVPAQWKFHGKGAGPIRNSWMLKFTKVDTVVAFPGGSGTRNMVKQATEAGLKIIEVKNV